MTEHWDKRYSTTEYAYGVEPNEFVKNSLLNLNLKGKALFPAEGEGRNAVFGAKQGFDVTAFDISTQGKIKALKLAQKNNVTLNYLIGDLNDLGLQENSFDIIVLNFAHFPPALRPVFHKNLVKLLKKDGVVILEGFSKNHLALSQNNPNLGGPKKLDMLFSIDEIKNDFEELEIVQLTEETTILTEGIYHNGESHVIRFIGKKI